MDHPPTLNASHLDSRRRGRAHPLGPMATRPAARVFQVLGAVATLLAVALAPQPAAAELPPWLFAPEPDAVGLFPADFDQVVDGELTARRNVLASLPADDPAAAVERFAIERLEATRASLRGESAATDPDLAAELRLLAERGDAEGAVADDLAIAVAWLESERPNARRRAVLDAADTLAEAAAAIDGQSALAASLALRAAAVREANGEAKAGGQVLDLVEDRAGAYDPYITWRRAEIARARGAAPTAERLYFALLDELRSSGLPFEAIAPAFLDRLYSHWRRQARAARTAGCAPNRHSPGFRSAPTNDSNRTSSRSMTRPVCR